MRLFIAIELARFVTAHLGKMQDALRPIVDARWTPPEQLHLTLKFLGETLEERVSDLLKSLQAVRIDEEISLRVNGLACFPPRGALRIIAAALEDAGGRCGQLQERIDRACHAAGFALEGRRWTAHVTLARLKHDAASSLREKAVAAVAGLLPGPEFCVEEFSVFESRLERQGPIYARIA
jgi:2'-5' RNA ligase